MTPVDGLLFVVLASLWGASFLFMRIAAPEFGPVALIGLRVAIAAVVLVPLAGRSLRLRERKRDLLPLVLLGVLNSALPFTLFAYATLSLTAGFTSVINATSPLFTALLGWLWLGDRLERPRVVGLVVGFVGVALLVRDRIGLKGDLARALPAIGAALVAALLYGIAANYTKKRLMSVPPLVASAVCQVGAAVVLLPFTILKFPAVMPSGRAWGALVALGVACTALAYVIFFPLIARLGPVRAIAVTFLIPAFGMLWGAIFLAEPVTPGMLGACAVILCGTAMATGFVGGKKARLSAES